MPSIRTANNRRRSLASRRSALKPIDWYPAPGRVFVRVRGGTPAGPLSETTTRRVAAGIAKMLGTV